MGETEQSDDKEEEYREGNVICHKGDQQAYQMTSRPQWDLCTDVKMTSGSGLLLQNAFPSYDTWRLLLLTSGQEVLNQISSGPCLPSEIALKNETTVHPSS